jgi:hypothetical protein
MALTEVAGALGVTVGDVLQRIRRDHLQTSHRRALNVLASSVDSDDDIVTVAYVGGNPPQGGDLLEIDDELLFVVEANGAAATVIRGFDGSTAASHTAGAVIELNPRVTNVGLLAHMRSEVRSWPRSLFGVASGDFSVPADTSAIDLTGASASWEHVRLLGVWRSPSDGEGYDPYDWRESWPRVTGVRLEPRQETDDFASGWALVLPTEYGDARDLRVVVGHSFPTGTWARSTDLGTTIGMTSDLLEIVELGAIWRATLGREQERVDVFAAGTSRRDEAVPAGAIARIALQYRQLRDMAVRDATKRLAAAWGWSESHT